MSYETGFFKYILYTPLTIVGAMSMYVFGGGIITLLNTFHHLFLGDFINAFVEYFITSALPPTSIGQILIQVAVGSVVAGIKWYLAVGRF